jgi:hypothetical protein
MAGIEPTFITGATAKIRLNGKTLAFCQDFSCSVQILTKTPKVLGKYEGDSVEPLSYMVSGSFSIIRYAKGIKKILGNKSAPSLADNDAGNGVGNWGTAWGGKSGDILARNGIGNDGRAHEALDPSKYAAGTTFDIQIFQKVNNGSGQDFLGVLNIRSARIVQADFGLNKRSAAIERFNFVALYTDGDGFVANASN